MSASKYLRYECRECGKPRFTSAKVEPVRCYPCELDRRNLAPTRIPSARARAESSIRPDGLSARS